MITLNELALLLPNAKSLFRQFRDGRGDVGGALHKPWIWQKFNDQRLTARPSEDAKIDHIVQYWDQGEPPQNIKDCIEKNKTKAQTLSLFDRQMAREFIQKHYNDRILAAFECCWHPAMRSDLFRLLYIYQNGGVYLDADDVLLWNPSQLIDDGCDNYLFLYPFFLFEESGRLWRPAASELLKELNKEKASLTIHSYFNNSYIHANPENPIIGLSILVAAEQILTDDPEFLSIHGTTGPGLLSVGAHVYSELSKKNGLPPCDVYPINPDAIELQKGSPTNGQEHQSWRTVNSPPANFKEFRSNVLLMAQQKKSKPDFVFKELPAMRKLTDIADRTTYEYAYLLLLGREPESMAMLDDAVLTNRTIEQVRNDTITCDESKAKIFSTLAGSSSKWVATEVLDQYLMWVNLFDQYVSAGCLQNNWEPDETSFFISQLNSGDTVLDIGANIGWFTLVAAKHIGPGGTIHAFEPRPDTFKMLSKTIALNNLSSVVRRWQYALSDEAGELGLAYNLNGVNPGGSFVSKSDIPGISMVRVPAVRLDDLLPDVAPDIIKIDVEGAEPLVFAGAINALKRGKPVILSELLPSQLMRVSGKTPAQYIEQMEEYGYVCYLLEGGRPGKRLKDFPRETGWDLVSCVFEWQGSR